VFNNTFSNANLSNTSKSKASYFSICVNVTSVGIDVFLNEQSSTLFQSCIWGICPWWVCRGFLSGAIKAFQATKIHLGFICSVNDMDNKPEV